MLAFARRPAAAPDVRLESFNFVLERQAAGSQRSWWMQPTLQEHEKHPGETTGVIDLPNQAAWGQHQDLVRSLLAPVFELRAVAGRVSPERPLELQALVGLRGVAPTFELGPAVVALCGVRGRWRVTVSVREDQASRAFLETLPLTDDSWTDEDEQRRQAASREQRHLNTRLRRVRRVMRDHPDVWADIEARIEAALAQTEGLR